MNAPDPIRPSALPDVQAATDQRHVAIQRVGVKGVRHPLVVRNGDGSTQSTVGTWSLDVALPETQKGTHMSRFIALIESERAPLSAASLRALLASMVALLEADSGRIEISYPLFVRKSAPVSGVASLMDYEVTMTGRIERGESKIRLCVVAPVTSLCPCSKEISEYGAHNQRSHVTIEAELVTDLDAVELIRIAEDEASAELYGMLKRPDEKYVTERAYDNPKFVEDLVRDVVGRLERDARIGHYVVQVENFESIHNHSAYARIERGPASGF